MCVLCCAVCCACVVIIAHGVGWQALQELQDADAKATEESERMDQVPIIHTLF